MNKFRKLHSFMLDERGVSSIEYAIIGAMIIAVCVIAIAALGLKTQDLFDSVLQLWK